MLTMRAKYGLKAMADLAEVPSGQILQSREISERHGISKKFLDAILADLKSANLILARKGPTGGYLLARPPENISVGQIVRALDGPLAPIGCASRTVYVPCSDCEDEASCRVRLTMLDVRDAISSVLDGKSLRVFARGSGPAA